MATIGTPVRRRRDHVKARCHQAFGLSGDPRIVAIDLAEQIRHIISDRIDDMKPERFRSRKARGCTDRLDRPFGIATMEFGQPANIGHGIVDDLARLGVLRLGRQIGRASCRKEC